MSELRLEFDDENQRQFGPCECCGKLTNRAWGYGYRDESAIAVDYVEWTPGHARNEIIGHPVASEIFEILDTVYLKDPRISELKANLYTFRTVALGPQTAYL